jgi:hypothetical protein
MGAHVATAVVEPGRVTITTTDGLTLDGGAAFDTAALETWGSTDKRPGSKKAQK